MSSIALSPIDLFLIVSYLAVITGLGLWASRGIRTSRDYFLAGKSLPWWAAGMSLVVSDIGAKDMIGLAGDGFRYGIVMMNFDFVGCILPVLVAAFLFNAVFLGLERHHHSRVPGPTLQHVGADVLRCRFGDAPRCEPGHGEKAGRGATRPRLLDSMMPLDFAALVVIFLYLCCLAVVLFFSPRLASAPAAPVPFWKNVRFWASFAAIVQIIVYTVWG
ncbi:MAG: sodium:solute symporter family transporter [Vicinamibacteria bacterium]